MPTRKTKRIVRPINTRKRDSLPKFRGTVGPGVTVTAGMPGGEGKQVDFGQAQGGSGQVQGGSGHVQGGSGQLQGGSGQVQGGPGG